jgi:predicted metal-dependent enzyme (double-stranded beta helix superfamily)
MNRKLARRETMPTDRNGRPPFDLQRFIADCRDALREDSPERAMREVAARAIDNPAAILTALGEPKRAEIQRLHHTPELTILNVIWAPRMTLMPHDHRMWAVIGVYSGREDNIFWRRLRDDAHGRVEAAGARALSNGDAVSLGRDIIHSVTNPIARLTAALHIYGGDFFAQPRSEWDPETLLERPFDVQRAQRLFEEANARG